MNTSQRLLVSIASAAAITALAPVAAANADTATSYGATLNSINGSGASGMLTLSLNGTQATVTEHWSGLAAKFGAAAYPHVQHIHIGAMGTCPTMSADKNGDGVISTTEGAPSYGAIGTTLSVSGDTSPAAGTNLKIAPAGPSTDYKRTIDLDSATIASIQGGTAVIVVHGLDPATLSKQAQGEKSDLVPSLPLAATSPALCGALTAWPTAPQTGAGSTAGPENLGIFGLAGGLLALGGTGMVLARRRSQVTANNQG
jgi:hypothetical protein